jgi:hypothetical protein
VRRGGLWAKHMGLKQGAIWEQIGNLMGTHWELETNMLGTKEKKTGPLRTHECMLSLLLIDSMKLFISKTVCHHF